MKIYIQAEEFLKKTNTEFTVKFLKYDFHFPDDKEKRDIYEITLKRGNRSYTFKFGNSIDASGEYTIYPSREKVHLSKNANGKPNMNLKGFGFLNRGNSKKNENFKIPSAYDILSCVQKSYVGDFKEFCADFGYDTDSRNAERIYYAVLDEWNNIKMLYSDEEIKELQEIE